MSRLRKLLKAFSFGLLFEIFHTALSSHLVHCCGLTLATGYAKLGYQLSFAMIALSSLLVLGIGFLGFVFLPDFYSDDSEKSEHWGNSYPKDYAARKTSGSKYRGKG